METIKQVHTDHQAFSIIEKALLGLLLTKGDLADYPSHTLLEKGHFVDSKHQIIFAACHALLTNKMTLSPSAIIDYLTQKEQLNGSGGSDYIHLLAKNANPFDDITSLEEKIFHAAQLRKMRQDITGLLNTSHQHYHAGEFLESALNMLNAYSQVLHSNVQSYTIQESLERRNQHLAEVKKNKRRIDGIYLTGVPSGFRSLDKLTLGWQRGHLVVVAARPGLGKSAMAVSFIWRALKDNQRVALFSLEMSALEITNRITSSSSGVPLNKLFLSDLDTDSINRITAQDNYLQDKSLTLYDVPQLTIPQLDGYVGSECQQKGQLDLVLVDYLQLMHAPEAGKNSNRVQEVSIISRGLKAIAKKHQCTVIAMAQLNRAVETRKTKRPQLADLRESGSIEQDADIVILLRRHEEYDKEGSGGGGHMVMDIAKNRNGPTGAVDIMLKKDTTSFTEMEKTDYDYPVE